MPLALLVIVVLLALLVNVNWLGVALLAVATIAGIQMGRGGLYVGAPVEPPLTYAALDVVRGRISIPDFHLYYRDLVEHLASYEGQAIYAGPDSPEVYFLAGALNPSRAFFEVLVPDWRHEHLPSFLNEHSIEVVVIKNEVNHSDPMPEEVLQQIAAQYPLQTEFGWFTVYQRP